FTGAQPPGHHARAEEARGGHHRHGEREGLHRRRGGRAGEAARRGREDQGRPPRTDRLLENTAAVAARAGRADAEEREGGHGVAGGPAVATGPAESPVSPGGHPPASGGAAARRPSKMNVVTASARASPDRSPPGRYHSMRELTVPNMSLLARRGSRSGRMPPSAAARATSSATRWSNSRRRARARFSASLLPCTRSSSVTYGSSRTRTFTARRTVRSRRAVAPPGASCSSSRTANSASSARLTARSSNSSLPETWW